MRFFTHEHVYPHDWDTVTAAFWVKYADSLTPHVKRVDTINRQFAPHSHEFRLKRVLSLRYPIPNWIQKVTRVSSEGFSIEETTCNRQKKSLILKTHNHTFNHIFRIEESCEYVQHPDEPKWTLYRQEASYTAHCMGLLGRTLELAGLEVAEEKVGKGLHVMQRIISNLEASHWKRAYASMYDRTTAVCIHCSAQIQNRFNSLITYPRLQMLTSLARHPFPGLVGCLRNRIECIPSLDASCFTPFLQAFRLGYRQASFKDVNKFSLFSSVPKELKWEVGKHIFMVRCQWSSLHSFLEMLGTVDGQSMSFQHV